MLKNFGALLLETTKGGDCVARYGGEEFVIILPETPLQEAAGLAEQIRKKLEAQKWKTPTGTNIGTVTASFGVSQRNLNDTPAELVARTDAKLYESKAGGRNRVTR